MSRRRGEFEHRTSIFEGAFRAWSHLGGLDPTDLESKPAAEMDPLTNPIVNDPRLSGKLIKNPDGTTRREYPYEPLPRSGLAHPYVQAILSPWLGPDADNEAIQLGLTTLRTWWQHRRKGESGSAIAALGTEKMKGVVEGYTRHFFTLAHCVVVNDKVQPPRGLHAKMKELDKMRSKKRKAAKKQEAGSAASVLPIAVSQLNADLTDPNLTPLEKLHVAQRRQLESSGGISSLNEMSLMNHHQPVINMKGKCIPGKIDLPGMMEEVSRHQATQLAHRGGLGMPDSNNNNNNNSAQYGDPNTTPVVFVSGNGDIQIAMKVDGITCAHCVKIVETVLRGCNGNKSPIDGLLDAAADRDLSSVLIKIDKASNAKRIAFEAARNLSMVGYTAEPKSMAIVGAGADSKAVADLGSLSTAFEVVANTATQDVFDWTIPCTCPDNGVLRGDCSRHSQMNTRIFDAFSAREQQVTEFMAGCGMKYGMDCTCGPGCRCKSCELHNPQGQARQQQQHHQQPEVHLPPAAMPSPLGQDGEFQHEAPIHVDQPMQFSNFGMGPPAAVNSDFGMGPPAAVNPAAHSMNPIPLSAAPPAPTMAAASAYNNNNFMDSKPPARTTTNMLQQQQQQQQQRNPSVLSYGGNNGLRSSIRGMSITSETTFGRAMSGLSALSIDWENLDDFDLDVDHSAHINNAGATATAGGDGARRSSLRRSLGSQDGAHVSFKV